MSKFYLWMHSLAQAQFQQEENSPRENFQVLELPFVTSFLHCNFLRLDLISLFLGFALQLRSRVVFQYALHMKPSLNN